MIEFALSPTSPRGGAPLFLFKKSRSVTNVTTKAASEPRKWWHLWPVFAQRTGRPVTNVTTHARIYIENLFFFFFYGAFMLRAREVTLVTVRAYVRDRASFETENKRFPASKRQENGSKSAKTAAVTNVSRYMFQRLTRILAPQMSRTRVKLVLPPILVLQAHILTLLGQIEIEFNRAEHRSRF
jgi:hypothetical protein